MLSRGGGDVSPCNGLTTAWTTRRRETTQRRHQGQEGDYNWLL